jgi:ATP/maltotriose-dependent transcriptional regulator MalT
MKGNTLEVSSTELRLGDKEAESLLDPAVSACIKNNRLYTNF